MKYKTMGYRFFSVINCVFLALLAFVCFYPFYYVVVASVSNPDDLIKFSGLLYKPLGAPTLDGYRLVFREKLVLSGFMNTLIILVVGLAFNMLLTVVGAYVLSLRELLLRKPLTILVVVTMYFNGGLIPTYLNVRSLGMLDTLWALILPGAISTGNLIIMRSAFMGVPHSLVEAAKIDGASYGRILAQIMLPLVKATLAVLVLYYSVGHWNSWFPASIYLRTNSLFPLQLVLRNILIEGTQTSEMMSDIGASKSPQVLQLIRYSLIVVSSVPIIIIYPFLQRFFEKGVTVGAVKG